MSSGTAPRVCAHPGAGACARLVGELEARNAARNAEIAARSPAARLPVLQPSVRPTAWAHCNQAKHQGIVDRVVGSGGGFLTFRSSPFVMWLASRLAAAGEICVAVVEDDLEELRKVGWRP